MQTLKLKQLNKLAVLKEIDRSHLNAFMERFKDDFNAIGLPLPPPDASDDHYFRSLAGLLNSPERLPEPVNDALIAIGELAGTQGLARLQATADWPARQPLLKPNSTAADIVLQLWLANPDYVLRAYNTARFKRLTTFEHAAVKYLRPSGVRFAPDDKLMVLNLTMALDAWFARNDRGCETTRVEVYPLEDEFWFLIRHGGLFTRTPKVERQATHILQFRPERDDVVVVSRALDEIRVNARTKSERDLYIQQFGLHFAGDLNHFSERKTLTLDPLLRDGAAALEPDGLEGIRHIALREVQVHRQNHLNEVITHEADDLFGCAPAGPFQKSPFPEGRLSRAVFEIQFNGILKPQPVEIRPPNTLKFGRGSNVRAVKNWLTLRGFRQTGNSAEACLVEVA
jgi:hypothetical protein